MAANARTPSRNSLEARILAVRDRLTQKQHNLARLLLDDAFYVAFASAEDVGHRAGVDAATVVRFSQLLGYDGYASLRDEVRGTVPQFLTALQKISRTVEGRQQTGDVIADVLAHDIRNIEETARLNPPKTLQTAVEILDRARHVFVLGSGIAAYVAESFAHQLALVGVPVQRAPRTLAEGTVDVASARKGDAVVVISLWRYLNESVRLFEAAREADATTIAVTDSKVSPLAAGADVALIAATNTPELTHSVTAIVTLTNVLATGLALARPDRTVERLRNVDAIFDRIEAL